MSNLFFLILFPFFLALLTYLAKEEKTRSVVVIVGSLIVMVADIIFCIKCYNTGQTARGLTFVEEPAAANHIIMACELFLFGLVTYLSVKYKKLYCILLSFIGTFPVLWLDITGRAVETKPYMRVDNLTLIMCIIVGLVGGMICIYAVGYLHGYHHHHTDVPNRANYFQALLFVFIGAMFGLVTSDNLSWLFFFWEITSVTSFLLIGYPRSE